MYHKKLTSMQVSCLWCRHSVPWHRCEGISNTHVYDYVITKNRNLTEYYLLLLSFIFLISYIFAIFTCRDTYNLFNVCLLNLINALASNVFCLAQALKLEEQQFLGEASCTLSEVCLFIIICSLYIARAFKNQNETTTCCTFKGCLFLSMISMIVEYWNDYVIHMIWMPCAFLDIFIFQAGYLALFNSVPVPSAFF